MSSETKNHESIHWQQHIETGILGFFFLYFIYWIIGFIKHRNGKASYYAIPFEKEAYNNQYNLEYLDSRKRYCWIKL